MIELLAEVDSLILSHDCERAVNILEKLSAEGLLSASDEVALALILMMPPLVDDEATAQHSRLAVEKGESFVGGVWGEYVFVTLYPVHDIFTSWLEQHTHEAEACYMLACHADFHGNSDDVRRWVGKSISIRPFPNALLLASKYTATSTEKQRLREQAKSLVRIPNVEKLDIKGRERNREDIRRNRWAELILGEEITSVVWDYHYAQ